MDDTLAEYWRDVSPIFKQQNAEQREKYYDKKV